MPKDTLKQLDRDVDRMLFAGAQLARTDAGLLGAKEKLAPLAARAPALGKVAEQIDKLAKSSGKTSATELLGLAMLMAQVRGAQAAPALPTEHAPLVDLPPAPRIGTPLSPTELGVLVAALSNTHEARYRGRTIREFVLRGAARDLRLLPLCIPALSDPGVADAVEQSLIPALGEAIGPELRAALDIEKGRAIDVRLLRAITRVEGEKAAGLCAEVVTRGGAEMRAAAIEELGRIDAVAAEPIATVLAEKDRSKEVRVAAVSALAKATSDAAFEVLLRAFHGPAEMRHAAEGALAQSTHAEANARIVALFSPELMEFSHFKVKRATTTSEKEEGAKAQKAHDEKVEYLVDLVDLLAARGTAAAFDLVLEAFRRHKIKEVRDAGARALLRVGYPGAWEELLPSLYEATGEAQEEFVRGVVALDPEKAYDKLARFFEPAALQNKNGMSLAARILLGVRGASPPLGIEAEVEESAEPSLAQRDPRWVDLAVDHCEIVDLRLPALAVLAGVDAPRTLEAGLTISRVPSLPAVAVLPTMKLLTKHRDSRVLHAFLRLLEPLRSPVEYGQACDVMTKYDDPALAPMLRSFLAAKQAKRRFSKTEMAPFEECLRFLERSRSEGAPDAGAPEPE